MSSFPHLNLAIIFFSFMLSVCRYLATVSVISLYNLPCTQIPLYSLFFLAYLCLYNAHKTLRSYSHHISLSPYFHPCVSPQSFIIVLPGLVISFPYFSLSIFHHTLPLSSRCLLLISLSYFPLSVYSYSLAPLLGPNIHLKYFSLTISNSEYSFYPRISTLFSYMCFYRPNQLL